MKISGQIKIEKKEFDKIKKDVKNVLDFEKTIEKNFKKEITQLLGVCLTGSIILNASDIHIEVEKEKVKIRLRIDGLLHDITFLDMKTYKLLLSRIKLLSTIKLNVRSKAQDGRFTLLLGQELVEIRVSTLPSEYGESLVLRVLNPENLMKIKDLGVGDNMLTILEKEIQQPNGMIIVSGPTGSGKTTSLYAILKKIQNPRLKIISIEDPIEYHLKGISQTQVNPKKGYDFPSGLKAIIRQDPDVILVGEIRDLKTATIALQASLTGHLVLTTLHTNDSTGVIARLSALGEKLNNIAPAINLVMGQRLIRRVCKKCNHLSALSEEEIMFFKKNLSSLPKNLKIPIIDKNLKISRPKGCADCNLTGYKGRIGIFEFFLIDSEMENFILTSPSSSDLRKTARKKGKGDRGMITMRENGLIKVLEGITTIEEINRVTSR